MAYTLEAILGPRTVLDGLAIELSEAPPVLVSLGQGIAMAPMTDELFDAVSDGRGERPLGFGKLPSGFDRTLAAASQRGPIAYVEADFFGGDGTQRAVVWAGGHISLGPLQSDEGGPFPVEGSPISQALRALGVESAGHHDEFAAVGLAAHRHTDGWLRSPHRER